MRLEAAHHTAPRIYLVCLHRLRDGLRYPSLQYGITEKAAAPVSATWYAHTADGLPSSNLDSGIPLSSMPASLNGATIAAPHAERQEETGRCRRYRAQADQETEQPSADPGRKIRGERKEGEGTATAAAL